MPAVRVQKATGCAQILLRDATSDSPEERIREAERLKAEGVPKPSRKRR